MKLGCFKFFPVIVWCCFFFTIQLLKLTLYQEVYTSRSGPARPVGRSIAQNMLIIDIRGEGREADIFIIYIYIYIYVFK